VAAPRELVRERLDESLHSTDVRAEVGADDQRAHEFSV
jgi:hypothetical protein